MFSNRLAGSTSPYLLQHAHNPVDWHPWGPEAIALARSRNVPIFLSIGYSTCYWCHVMERESFENERVARQINAQFVAVKVDREERPDIDDAYMAATQMITGSGGWPMTVFVEPERLRPFWAGTYFPPAPSRGMPGLPEVLERMSTAWRERPEEVRKQAAAVARAVDQRAQARKVVPVSAGHIANAVQTLLTIFDRSEGGFGRAPKFPQPVYLELLLDARARMQEPEHEQAIDAALRTTLDKMAIGGLFDQVGGGFHRYSVDAHWTVPHFEKMLYDNAQLLGVYARASVALGDGFYRRVALRTAGWALREMLQRAPGLPGAFSTAQDAEVDGHEGQNYVWTREQVEGALAPQDARLALELYGVVRGPNFADPHHPQAPAVSVLRLGARPEIEAARLGMSEADLIGAMERVNGGLLRARAQRKQARLDDKVLTAWNGLLIAGLADAGALLDEPALVDAAGACADALLGAMRDEHGRLLRCWRAGHAGTLATLEDYAMLAQGLLALGRATGQVSRVHQGAQLVHHALRAFASGAWEESGEGPIVLNDAQAQPGEEQLYVQARSTYDGAMPSATSAVLHALVDLAEQTGDGAYRSLALRVLAGVSGAIDESPIAAAGSTRAALRLLVADPDAFERAQARAGSAVAAGEAERAGAVAPHSVVQVYASADEVVLAPEAPAELLVRVEIAPGYHINDAFAGRDSEGTVTPLALVLSGGTGVAAYAEYPPGERVPGQAHGVHHREVEFPIAMECKGEWSGQPKLALVFQACTDSHCLAPQRVELDVVIRRED